MTLTDVSVTILLGYRPRWQADAACHGVTRLFYDPDFEERAKQVCSTCPVQRDCLRYAYDHGEHRGIWGGLNPQERLRLRW